MIIIALQLIINFMSDFIPRSEDKLLNWLGNLKKQIALVAPVLNLSQSEEDEAIGFCDNMIKSINGCEDARVIYNTKVKEKATILVNESKNIRELANRIKTNKAYTEAIGNQLQIVGTSTSDIDELTFKPTISVQLGHDFVRIKFTKNGVDGVNVYTRLSGEKTWTFLARDTHSPYDDHRPLAVSGTPEVREYQCMGVVNDVEIGQPSDIVSATFAG